MNTNISEDATLKSMLFFNKKNDFEHFIHAEKILFKKNQHLDYEVYRKDLFKCLEENDVKNDWLTYINLKKVNIAVYPGSFNPFTTGHYSILEKAEKIFDKVIIARGVNPDKNNEILELSDKIKNRQIETYNGLLTDFLDGLGYETTVIRGLRNATDLQYETTQYQFLKDLKPNIKVISIFCDPQFEHISSSSVRMLNKYGKGNSYLI